MNKIQVNVEPIGAGFDTAGIDPWVGGLGGKAIEIPGLYPAYISAMEVKENSGGNGHHLKLEYLVSEGEFKGSKVWTQLNLWHDTEKTVGFANQQFAALVLACGFTEVADMADVAGIVHMILIDYTPPVEAGENPNTGEEIKARPGRNDVKGWEAYVAPEAAASPKNFGGSPVKGAPPAGMKKPPVTEEEAPAEEEAAEEAAEEQQAPVTQTKPAFKPGGAKPAPAAAGKPAAGKPAAGTPPWQKK